MSERSPLDEQQAAVKQAGLLFCQTERPEVNKQPYMLFFGLRLAQNYDDLFVDGYICRAADQKPRQ